jgi:hypothetical protein
MTHKEWRKSIDSSKTPKAMYPMQHKTTEMYDLQCKMCCSKKKKNGVPIIKDLLSSHGGV